MIAREQTYEAQQSWDMHWQFVTMMHACCRWPEKHDVSETIGYWWSVAYPERELTDEDITRDIFDKLRRRLAEIGGVSNPILPSNVFTEFVVSQLEFD